MQPWYDMGAVGADAVTHKDNSNADLPDLGF